VPQGHRRGGGPGPDATRCSVRENIETAVVGRERERASISASDLMPHLRALRQSARGVDHGAQRPLLVLGKGVDELSVHDGDIRVLRRGGGGAGVRRGPVAVRSPRRGRPGPRPDCVSPPRGAARGALGQGGVGRARTPRPGTPREKSMVARRPLTVRGRSGGGCPRARVGEGGGVGSPGPDDRRHVGLGALDHVARGAGAVRLHCGRQGGASPVMRRRGRDGAGKSLTWSALKMLGVPVSGAAQSRAIPHTHRKACSPLSSLSAPPTPSATSLARFPSAAAASNKRLNVAASALTAEAGKIRYRQGLPGHRHASRFPNSLIDLTETPSSAASRLNSRFRGLRIASL